MIHPWSEAERQRVEALAELEERYANVVSNMRQPLKDNEHGRNALALKSCLARAEQAERLERRVVELETTYEAIVNETRGTPASEFMLSYPHVRAVAELRQRAEQAEAKAASLWDRLHAIQQYPGTPGTLEEER